MNILKKESLFGLFAFWSIYFGMLYLSVQLEINWELFDHFYSAERIARWKQEGREPSFARIIFYFYFFTPMIYFIGLWFAFCWSEDLEPFEVYGLDCDDNILFRILNNDIYDIEIKNIGTIKRIKITYLIMKFTFAPAFFIIWAIDINLHVWIFGLNNRV